MAAGTLSCTRDPGVEAGMPTGDGGSGAAGPLSGAGARAEAVDGFSAGSSEPTVWGLCHVLLLHLIFGRELGGTPVL